MNKKINLLLLFGGESAEHEVSIKSAGNVYHALDQDRYDVSLAYIDRAGQWWRVDSTQELKADNRLSPVLGEASLVDAKGDRLAPDVMLPILHGPNGEDGSVQGLAQLLHIPMVGCGVIGSAVCMDKDVAKRLLRQAGIHVVDYVLHRSADPAPDFTQLTQQLGDTLFVKPANMGSSVGVSKVSTKQALADALAEAHKHDRKVLIERAVIGRELECSILGNDQPEASVVGEIKPGEGFYSYEAKYAEHSTAQTSTDAGLASDLSDSIRQTAIRAYKALECRGLSRVDFFLTEDGTLYVNEINTMPGFTNISMYPKLWEASGLSYGALLDKLVDLALQ